MASLLLDSGPLILYIYGLVRPDMVGKGKTKQFSLSTCNKLLLAVHDFSRHISLPNILTEASNHIGAGEQQFVPGSANFLANYATCLDEIYMPSKEVVKISEYMKVGLADAAIISCTPRLIEERVRVFTQDYALYNRLSGYGVDCVNISHWGTPAR